MKPQILLSSDLHRNRKVVIISFEYNLRILNTLKKHFPARWSKTKNCWWIKRTEFDYWKFKEVLSPIAEIIPISDKKTEPIIPVEYLDKLEQKRYSLQTITTHTHYFKDFQKYFIDKKLSDISIDEINNYLLELIRDSYTLELLRNYYTLDKPKLWVSEGVNGLKYSAESVLNVVKLAAKRAKIRKSVYTHILRNSFATHHLEQGTDLRYIQKILGHESSKTTEIYTHVSKKSLAKIKSPLDTILKDK